MNKLNLLNIVFLWLAWLVIILSFQWITADRFDFKRPDLAVSWTKTETLLSSNKGKVYLLEPTMNRQVAWDSEYYMGIAVGGYDDSAAAAVTDRTTGNLVKTNYSFFPFYPYVMRVFAAPLGWFGLKPIAAASLAGVIVAALGTLAGLIALWDMTSPYFDEQTAERAVFYALIFPASFFFAMVYTEGLFIGLAFGALALSKRGQWAWASLLGLCAAWTRAHGAALVLPLLIFWLMQINWHEALKPQLTWKWFLRGAFALLPLAGYLVWRNSPLGMGWAELQDFYFGRGLLSVQKSIADFKNAYDYAMATGGVSQVYYAIEVGSILLACIASLWLLMKRRKVGSAGPGWSRRENFGPAKVVQYRSITFKNSVRLSPKVS